MFSGSSWHQTKLEALEYWLMIAPTISRWNG